MRWLDLRCGLALVSGWSLSAAQLSVGSVTTTPARTTVIPVVFTGGGDALSGVQFDIEVSGAGVMTPILAQSPRQAGKSLLSSKTESAARLLISGINRTQLADGPLLLLYLSETAGNTASSCDFHFTNITGVDEHGSPVQLEPLSGTVMFGAGGSGSALEVSGVLNAASMIQGPVAPGEILDVVGAIGPAANTESTFTEVSFDEIDSFLLYAVPDHLQVLVPFGIAGRTRTTLSVKQAGSIQASVVLPTAPVSPGIFVSGGGGSGIAVLNHDYSLNSSANPARKGSVIIFYGTGLGVLNPAPALPTATGLSRIAAPVAVSIGGVPAVILYAGTVPGLNAGVAQLNVLVPPGARSGVQPLLLTTDGVQAQPELTVAVE